VETVQVKGHRRDEPDAAESFISVVTRYIHILITIKESKMTKVTSQALYKKNIQINEKKKKINESSGDF